MLDFDKYTKYMAICFTIAICFTRLSKVMGHVFYAIGSILFLYCLYQRRDIISISDDCKNFMKPYMFMLLCFIPSVIFSVDFIHSLKVFFDLWIYKVIVFFSIVIFVKSKNLLNTMLMALIVSCCLDSIFAGFQMLKGVSTRPVGFGGHTLGFAGFLTIVFPLVLIFSLDQRIDQKLQNTARLGLVSSILGLFANKSRGAWLSVALGTFLTTGKYIIVSKKRILASVLIVISLTSFFVFNPRYNRRLASVTNITTDRSNGDRIEVWKSSYKMFFDRPATGVGINNFKPIYQKYYRTKADTQNLPNTHNNFIQIAVETGAIGLLGYLFFLVNAFWLFGRNYLRRNNPYDLVSFSILLMDVVLFGLIEHTWGNSSNVRIMWFILAIVMQLKSLEKQ